MVLEYSKKVMQEFLHPKNMGEIKNPDGIGKIGNPVCGDVMWVYIKIGHRSVYPKEVREPLRGPKLQNKGAKITEEYLKDIKFKTFGCTAAIASSSMITQLVKGKTFEEAQKIGIKDIAKSLKGLPPIKMHCTSMAAEGLKLAIKDYKEKEKK